MPRRPSLLARGNDRFNMNIGGVAAKFAMGVMLVWIVILLIIVIHYSACNLTRLFGWEKMGGYEAENSGAGRREQMSRDWNLMQSEMAERMGCGKRSVTEGMYGGVSEGTNGGAEGMYGGPNDYSAGCLPCSNTAFRGSHDYNLVGYKPPHLINLYPSRHAFVNDI